MEADGRERADGVIGQVVDVAQCIAAVAQEMDFRQADVGAGIILCLEENHCCLDRRGGLDIRLEEYDISKGIFHIGVQAFHLSIRWSQVKCEGDQNDEEG